MQFLPVFLNVRAQHCLVVGGGEVAYRKAVLLDRAGARLRVVAPAIDPQLEALVIAGAGELCLREFQDNDLDGVFLAVAATDDEAVNAAVSVGAKARGLPVNVVDKPSLCSFIVPAIVDRSPVVIAISSGGASPILTRKLKEKLETLHSCRLRASRPAARQLPRPRQVRGGRLQAAHTLLGKPAVRAVSGNGAGGA